MIYARHTHTYNTTGRRCGIAYTRHTRIVALVSTRANDHRARRRTFTAEAWYHFTRRADVLLHSPDGVYRHQPSKVLP